MPDAEPMVEEDFFDAARRGDLDKLRSMLAAGFDVNTRESGDNTYAMHWAAAAGDVEAVSLLAEAGGDVIGDGDDHELEVIGWATCWDGCDDDSHRAVVDLLLSRGARHHIFSAIAMNLATEVRRIVATDPSSLNRRMSRNENNAMPLHFAVRMKRPDMVSLLVELGADPLAVDAVGQPVAAYAESRDIDRPVMEAIRRNTLAEIMSADRGSRDARGAPLDLAACLALRDWDSADRLVRDNPDLLAQGGALHLMSKRDDVDAVRWLLDHGANVNTLWTYADSEVTALHIAAGSGSTESAKVLLGAGADASIRDNRYHGDPKDWAEHFGQIETRRLFEG